MSRENASFEKKFNEDKAKWPSHVEEIGIGHIGYLGIDSKGNLYWDGKPIEVRKTFDLRWWQIALAVMTALGAFLSGIVALYSVLVDAFCL